MAHAPTESGTVSFTRSQPGVTCGSCTAYPHPRSATPHHADLGLVSFREGDLQTRRVWRGVSYSYMTLTLTWLTFRWNDCSTIAQRTFNAASTVVEPHSSNLGLHPVWMTPA